MLLNFDYDGVIVDSIGQSVDMANRAQKDLGLGRPPTQEDFRRIQDLTYEGIGKLIGIPDKQVATYARTVLDLLAKDNRHLNFVAGIQAVINQLSNDHALVIITSTHSEVVFRSMQSHNLDRKIHKIMGAELGLTKMERITLARKELKIEKSQTFMIGDAMSDIRQGKLAGVKTIAVTWGYQNQKFLAGESPDFMVDHPDHLLEILEK